MAVRSKLLGFNASQGTGQTTLYTVPSGRTTIVKSVQVRNTGGAAAFLAIATDDGANTRSAFRIYLAAQGTNGDSVILSPWLVMEQGDRFLAAASAGTMIVTLSGAELLD